MTAIKKYTRLEAVGFWRESTNSEEIEVLITFGKTSIMLSDYKDNPLTHWSLAAIELVSKNKVEAIFSTDLENGEILKIRDPQMIDSFSLFINHGDAKPKSTNLIYYTATISLVILSILSVLLLPDKLRSLTASIISEAHEAQLVEPFLEDHIFKNGSACSSPQTDEILNSILTFVKSDIPILSVRIIRSQKMNVLHLPGGSILVSNEFLKYASNERSLIEILEQEVLRARNRYPLKTLINEQNLFLLLKFILGFEAKLPIKQINQYLVTTTIFPIDKVSRIDDFSWVALKNICLN